MSLSSGSGLINQRDEDEERMSVKKSAKKSFRKVEEELRPDAC